MTTPSPAMRPVVRRTRAWRVAGILAIVAVTACGGGDSSPPADVGTCDNALSMPPSDAIDARAAGAKGDGQSDDTAALQAALDALRPGQRLVFPPGTYVHSASLVIQQPGVVIDGRGATLHATNPDDQALMIQASGVHVHGFEMTAVTRSRLGAPWQSRIAVWRGGEGLAPLDGIAIVGNRIVEADGPGTPRANGSSSAGIFVHNARDFIVAHNTVRRSLADGIQVTGGSRRGQIVFNTVRETGDDMISVVSYVNETTTPLPAHDAAAALNTLREANLARDMLIADNDLSGQYWGRGVTVVGGEDIGILRNAIDATTHGAAVYLAREHGFGTFGVRNVRVEDNRITRVQTTDPIYRAPDGASELSELRTGHGAVELVATQYADEAAHAALRDELVVRGVRIAGNRVESSATPAVRTGYGYAQQWFDAQGSFSGATVSEVAFESNTMAAVAGGLEALNANDPALILTCMGNTLDGTAYANGTCRSATVAVPGSSSSVCAWPR